MLVSRNDTNDQPKILPEILKEKIATIQYFLTNKDFVKLKDTIITDLLEPIKKMCNLVCNPNKQISDAKELIQEAIYLEFYIDVLNGLLRTQTTSKTIIDEALDHIAKEFNNIMQKGSGKEKKKNFGTHKNPFYFLNFILQSQNPIETLHKAIVNIKEYGETAQRDMMADKPVERFEFPIIPYVPTIFKEKPLQAESKEIAPQKTGINSKTSIINFLKNPFYEIMSLKGESAFLDKAARLSELVTSHYMFTSYIISFHKVAIIIINTMLKRIAESDEKQRIDDTKTLLEFLNLLSLSNKDIVSKVLQAKPALLTRVQGSIQANLDSQTLSEFNKRFKLDTGATESKAIFVPESKIEKELKYVTNRRASTQTLVLKTLGEAISIEESDEAIIDAGQVGEDEALEGIERAEATRYEAEILLNPDLLSSPQDQDETTSAPVVEPKKIRAY